MPQLNKADTINAYRARLGGTILEKLGAAADIVVGGKTTPNVVPTINASKWEDEAWYALNPTWFLVKPSTIEVFDKGVISLQNGNVKWRTYIKDVDHIEKTIIFADKPSFVNNRLKLELLHSGNLGFLHQGPLKESELLEGHIRPDNIVNSYAIYVNKRNNKYCSGKFGHIYAPYFIDALGRIQKLEQWIDGNKLIISWDKVKEWLKTAVYPITLDPTLGYTTKGASAYDADELAYITWNVDVGDLVADSNGVCNTMYIYIENGSGRTVQAGIYDRTRAGDTRPNNLLKKGDKIGGWTAGPDAITLDSALTIVNGTAYCPGFQTDIGNGFAYYDDAGDLTRTAGVTELPDPDAGDDREYAFSVWLDYTEAGETYELSASISGASGTGSPGMNVLRKLSASIGL